MMITKSLILPRKKARLIAFYLPQYHPIPENDVWWGKGFTEWTNVAKAKPLYRGHTQPHLPSELGFYDLRIPEVRWAQAELAKESGIEGFCYWHYWFNGKMLLERPINEVLASGEPDFPFCLGWANHSWTGVWFGAQDKILIKQEYPGMEDHTKHFKYFLNAFIDPRYIKVYGKPLLMIYRPLDIPNIKQVTDVWRELAHHAGLPGLHLVGEGLEPQKVNQYGFDAANFAFHRRISEILPQTKWEKLNFRINEWLRKVFKRPYIYQYRDAMKFFFKPGIVPLNEYPGIYPGWDSTPRLGLRGVVIEGNTPVLFRQHVRDAFQRVEYKPYEERILFVKSWNEWAEGNYLEPDQVFGRAFLDVIKEENHSFPN